MKKRIMGAYLDLLRPLMENGTFRRITREMNPLQSSSVLPALMLYDGEDTEIGKNSQGIILQFPIAFKILVQDRTGLSDAKDDAVEAVLEIVELEANNQLGGLINGLTDFSEQPFISELNSPVGGALLLWTVQYRRKPGRPAETY